MPQTLVVKTNFVSCIFQWQTSVYVPSIFLIYRWVFGGIFLITAIGSVIQYVDNNEAQGLKWLVYLTHWGYMICTAQALLAAGLVTHRYVADRKSGEYIVQIFLFIDNIRLFSRFRLVFS